MNIYTHRKIKRFISANSLSIGSLQFLRLHLILGSWYADNCEILSCELPSSEIITKLSFLPAMRFIRSLIAI